MRRKVLIVDDEEAARYGMRRALETRTCIVLEAPNLASARFILEREEPDLILLDVNLPDGSGLDLLREVAARSGAPAVIVLTAHGSERVAVDAIRAGAYEYLSKPFEVDELRLLVRNALERAHLADENQALRAELAPAGRFGDMVGSSQAMKRIFEVVERVAATDATVLVRGESGTGKELVAREIHHRSPRAAMSFVSLNCASLPDTLIESELFGHEKGAFTGAAALRKGKFELADSGTLFLDEIGDMALATQAKVLRAIEERTIERLGSPQPMHVDVRIVCATHRDLEAAIAAGEFRQDLYYRIHVVSVAIPPLRERPGDVEPLLDYFGRLFAGRYRIEWTGFTPAARERMRDYPWPGNVRELRNLVERCVVLGLDGPIDVAALPAEVASAPKAAGTAAEQEGTTADELTGLPYEEARAAFERRYLMAVLERHGGNISQAASSIGLHRQTLQYKLKQLGIRRTWEEH